jgi:outer membrane protein TolC
VLRKAFRTAAEADVTTTAENIRALVTQYYITALQSEAQSAVLDTLVQTAAGQLSLVTAKMEAGAGTIIDIRTAEVALGQAQVASLTVHNNAKVDKLRLYQTMGVPADMNVQLATTFTIAQPTFSLDSVLDLARRTNPDIVAKKYRADATQLQVRVAQTSYLPSLSLNTGWGANAFGYTNSEILGGEGGGQRAGRACRTACSSIRFVRAPAFRDSPAAADTDGRISWRGAREEPAVQVQ